MKGDAKLVEMLNVLLAGELTAICQYVVHSENRRPDYLDAWWNIVNWPRVAERFNQAATA